MFYTFGWIWGLVFSIFEAFFIENPPSQALKPSKNAPRYSNQKKEAGRAPREAAQSPSLLISKHPSLQTPSGLGGMREA